MTRPTVPAAALFGAIVLLAGGCEKNITDADIEFADLGEVRRLTLDAERNPHAVLVMDPRSAKAFAEGHLPGAHNVDLAAFERDDDRKKWIEAYSEIVVYGDDPGSSVAKGLTKRLLHLSYDDVRMFAGGMMDWKKAGFPVETGETKPATTSSGAQ